MTEWWISALVILTGVIATSVGFLIAASRLRAAGRAYRKIAIFYDTMSDGWSAWFLGGFSGLTVGAHWVWAVVWLTVWMGAGLWFIVCGLRLFQHA